jgi:hypothetical protein
MGVVRESEKIAVPERGARLGNFGCQSFSDEIGYVFDAEWMQNDPDGWEVCAARGSDNSIFVTKVTY